MISRKKLASAVAVSVATAALLVPAGAAQAAPDPALWCWTMQSGNIKGTFSMSPNTPGDGTAPAATYTVTGVSVYETNNVNVPVGSSTSGEWAQGSMTPYQIVWSGSAVTTWQRNNNGNLLTNGIMMTRPSVSGFELHFANNFQKANDQNTTFFTSNVTPTLSPAPSTGLCAGQVAPTPSPSPSPSSSNSASQQTLANTGAQFPLFAGIAALIAGAAMLVLRRRSN
jgi:LPXTG-motif cell wall-anchored protein